MYGLLKHNVNRDYNACNFYGKPNISTIKINDIFLIRKENFINYKKNK